MNLVVILGFILFSIRRLWSVGGWINWRKL